MTGDERADGHSDAGTQRDADGEVVRRNAKCSAEADADREVGTDC
jgi:hypothetical protein